MTFQTPFRVEEDILIDQTWSAGKGYITPCSREFRVRWSKMPDHVEVQDAQGDAWCQAHKDIMPIATAALLRLMGPQPEPTFAERVLELARTDLYPSELLLRIQRLAQEQIAKEQAE